MSGCFYFISNKFYEDFPDKTLMKNKESMGGCLHDRPCFFAFPDSDHPEIFWLIPISSQIEKYKVIYEDKVKKYGFCNTIYFCNLLGYEKAFLIQNMFPITAKYIVETYVHPHTHKDVHVKPHDEKILIRKAKEVLRAYRNGKILIFTDIHLIESGLFSQK
ncbi:type III toxin-antitoxin system CptIN family toxin [Methanolapillus millepedarum]|uniref:Uncharacterized protein n=1 Tax=Methanolapillus millepedarum TaxID=3028296 RepID=A0AA96V4B7_9EURY|nr:hypothetical protein MsAc7_08210 [Methanosarcinaceae archaeon Ac7]